MKWFFRATAGLVGAVALFTLLSFSLPASASGGNPGIRQEINITDGYLGSLSGNFATSSAIVQFDGTKYTAPSAYFEVVASTSATLATNIYLRNATSSATVATISVPTGTTAYTRFRSSELTALASTTQGLVVVVGNESGATKGVIAARLVILDAGSPLSNQETQIEIGNQETITSGGATSSLASPKYWYYNAAGWDASPTFYAEVTYQVLGGVMASTSVYKTAGTYTITLPGGTASSTIGLWGGGGAGGSSTLSPGGGSGGAGGQFASSTLVATTSSHTLVVAAGAAAPSTPNPGAQGATSTWDGAVIVAGGGGGGRIDAGATTTATSTGCVGTTCFKGGDGANGRNTATQYGGGGGGGADSSGNGNSAGADATNGAAKGYGGAGAIKNVTAPSAGTVGGAAGGGGSGGNSSNATDKAGGAGGAGRADIYNYIATTTIALQEDDGNFNWNTNTTYIVTSNTTGAGSPTRFRSAAFTPTNGHHYRLAVYKGDSRTTIAIYNAKVVVDQAAVSLMTSYSETNADTDGTTFCGSGCGASADAQSFASTGGTLDSVKWYLKKTGAPGGNVVAKIYAITGTFGTNSVPTGAALATSDNVAAASITTSLSLVSFSFSGANRITLTNGSNYAVSVEPTAGDASGNSFIVGFDNSASSYNGDPSNNFVGSWSTISTANDFSFYVYTGGAAPTLLEPQYLLANTKLVSGTGLQNYLQNFDTTEWTTTNNYILGVSAANSSASVVELDNTTGPTQITGSVVTSPNNYATSTGMCLTSSAALDTKATTNNNDIYGVSVIAQVGLASTASCGGGAAAAGPQTLIFRDSTFTGRDSTITVRDH